MTKTIELYNLLKDKLGEAGTLALIDSFDEVVLKTKSEVSTKEDIVRLEGKMREDLLKTEAEIREDMAKMEGRMREDMAKMEGRSNERFTKIEGELKLIKWIITLLLAGVISLVMKAFFTP